MTAYIFLADGFEEMEAINAIDIFRRADFKVITVSVAEFLVTGTHGVCVIADTVIKECRFEKESLFYLPGGMPGTDNLDACEVLKQLIEQHNTDGQPIAAICAAPLILGKMGLLAGKEAICYPGYENFLTGSKLSDRNAVEAGNIFTAKAAGYSIEFALRIVEVLCGSEISENVKKQIFP
jgi:4-methyl-5(b-hydroxyethyl)-thiazole monophosphate biosynthesis